MTTETLAKKIAKRLLWWAKLLLVVCALYLVVAIAYPYRVYPMAWIWHLRHDAVEVGPYVVQVSKVWYVDELGGDKVVLMRLDTDDKAPVKRGKARASIQLFFGGAWKEEDLRQFLEKFEAIGDRGETASTRTINVAGSSMLCEGGRRLSPGTVDADYKIWSCGTTDGLIVRIAATEPDMDQAWRIVEGIRKKM